MKRVLIPLFLLALMLTGCSRSREPGTVLKTYANLRARLTNGRSELGRSLAARKDVKSYRMKVSLALHPGKSLVTDIEVSCPDRERIVSHIGESALETVRIGGDAFIQQRDGQWTKQAIPAEAYPCGGSPGAPSPWAMMNEGRDMSTIIGSMAENPKAPISVSPGAYMQVDGGQCQQWIVQFEHPGSSSNKSSSGMNYSLCLDPDTKLPRAVMMGSGGMTITYSDWNKPLDIAVPSEAKLASAAANTQQP
jgi:hypothetical protein